MFGLLFFRVCFALFSGWYGSSDPHPLFTTWHTTHGVFFCSSCERCARVSVCPIGATVAYDRHVFLSREGMTLSHVPNGGLERFWAWGSGARTEARMTTE